MDAAASTRFEAEIARYNRWRSELTQSVHAYHDWLETNKQLDKQSVANHNRRWHHLRIEARGPRYKVWVNGKLKINYDDQANSRPVGRLALAAYTGGVGECEVLYDNVVVRSLR